MLWVMGLLGLLAVSAAAYVDLGDDILDEDALPGEGPAPLPEKNVAEIEGCAPDDGSRAGDVVVARSGSQGVDCEKDQNTPPAETPHPPTESETPPENAAIAEAALPTVTDETPIREQQRPLAADTIRDFSPGEDSLVFVWDDSDTSLREPAVDLLPDPDHRGQLQVRLGDRIIAQVCGNEPLDAVDIALIPLSSAQALGFASP